jgi:hypothetical protein
MSRIVPSGETIIDSFPGIDLDGYSRVSGLSSFTTSVWRDGVPDATSVVISEIGSTGEYRISFDSGASGFIKIQILIDYNKDYWEWEFDVQDVQTQDIENHLDVLHELVLRALGLSQENVFIDNTVYDDDSQLLTSRVRIFDTKAHCELATDGGSETDGLLATYTQTTDWETINEFQFYRQVKE